MPIFIHLSVRKRNRSRSLARDDDVANNGDHGNRNKTGFISAKIPFYQEDRDTLKINVSVE
jgi:hypothetical protein